MSDIDSAQPVASEPINLTPLGMQGKTHIVLSPKCPYCFDIVKWVRDESLIEFMYEGGFVLHMLNDYSDKSWRLMRAAVAWMVEHAEDKEQSELYGLQKSITPILVEVDASGLVSRVLPGSEYIIEEIKGWSEGQDRDPADEATPTHTE